MKEIRYVDNGEDEQMDKIIAAMERVLQREKEEEEKKLRGITTLLGEPEK